MADTFNLGLPLIAPAQAQKHVTVNEALARLDGLVQLTLASVSVPVPPATVTDGVAYGVPVGATGDWDGQEGRIAVGSNGGWVFVTPAIGWRGFAADIGKPVVWDGSEWVAGALAVTPHRAHARFEAVEFDHVIAPGSVSVTAFSIPQFAMVLAVTGRIRSAITGTLTGWDLGVAGATDRYSSGLGLAQGSWLVGITGAPVTYYAPTPLVLTAQGGDFAGGEVRLVVHYFLATPPEA